MIYTFIVCSDKLQTFHPSRRQWRRNPTGWWRYHIKDGCDETKLEQPSKWNRYILCLHGDDIFMSKE